ncbi:Ig-like domain repeat protein [Spirillospora sp. NPDC052269]
MGRGAMAVLMAAACVVGGQAVAQRPAAAAPPTDIAFGTGQNLYGQLGDGTNTTPRLLPVRTLLPAGVTVTQVSGGDYHSLALTSDGRVLAWGRNDYGQIGDGTGTNRNTPVEVHMPSGVTVTQIAAGRSHGLALASDGRVFAWGANGAGQVGDGTNTSRYTPVQVHLPPGTTATWIAASHHSLAVLSDGRAFAWGQNPRGELGDGTTTSRNTPVEVHLPPGVTVKRVAGGTNTGLAVTSDGHALAWGDNSSGQLGIGSTTSHLTPVQVHLPTGSTVTQVSAGTAHCLALTSDGRVLAWGSNVQGQLGDDTTDTRYSPIETHMPPGATATQISAGWSFSLAVTSDGRALGWGLGGSGRLGNGDTANRFTPAPMVLPEFTAATAVAAGSYHSLILAEPFASRTSLAAHPPHARPGQQVSLTATVTCNAGIPTGTVTFTEGDQVIGTAELQADGTATLTTTELDEGEHHITAHYEGDAVCPPSTSDTVTVTITNEPSTAGLHLSKEFDGFVEPSGTKAKHIHHAANRHNARMMSAWREHDAIRYRFVVTNTGDVPISTVHIHDSHVGTITCSSHALEPGQSATCHGTHKVTSKEKSRGHVDNTATATGTRTDDGETVTSNKAHLRVDITYK